MQTNGDEKLKTKIKSIPRTSFVKKSRLGTCDPLRVRASNKTKIRADFHWWKDDLPSPIVQSNPALRTPA